MEYNISSSYIYEIFKKVSPNAIQKQNGTINGSCNICKEGKSWLKKKRLYYIPEKNIICCHNCQRVWSPINWIKESTGLSFKDIINNVSCFDYIIDNEQFKNDTKEVKNKKTQPDLPYESINLSNNEQLSFYKDNEIIKNVIEYIKKRRLDQAINKIDNYYISLKDYIHKNRLIIPFKNLNNKIDFYQSRLIFETDKYIPKYLSKKDSEKTIFGIDKINPNLEHLFIFEGPIDSMFVKNGISMAGLSISEEQKKQLDKLFFLKKIWILDNDTANVDVYNKYIQLINDNYDVFIWPKCFKNKIKDINELCCSLSINEIKPDFFIKNSFSGLSAKTRLIKTN